MDISPTSSTRGRWTPRPRPLRSGALLGVASRGSIAVVGAATTVLVARLLGPSESGKYFVAQSVIVILTVLATLGAENGITYRVSARGWDVRDAYRAAGLLALGLGALGVGVAMGLRMLVPSAFAGLSPLLTLTIAGALPFALLLVYASSIALATDSYEAYAVLPGLQAVLSLALVVIGALVFGIRGAVIGLAVAIALAGAGAAAWALRHPSTSPSRERGHLRGAVAFGLPGYASNALQIVNYRLDLFVLAAVASAAVVGDYSIAVAATAVIWVLPAAFADVLLPRVAHLTSRQAEQEREMAEIKSLRHVVLIVLITSAVLAFALEFVLVPILGAGFKPAVTLGLILLPGVALVPPARVLAATTAGRGKPTYALYCALVSTPITIALYATLIPSFGAKGAALGSTLSYLTSFVLLCWFYRRITARSLASSLIPTRSEFNDILAVRTLITHSSRASQR